MPLNLTFKNSNNIEYMLNSYVSQSISNVIQNLNEIHTDAPVYSSTSKTTLIDIVRNLLSFHMSAARTDNLEPLRMHRLIIIAFSKSVAVLDSGKSSSVKIHFGTTKYYTNESYPELLQSIANIYPEGIMFDFDVETPEPSRWVKHNIICSDLFELMSNQSILRELDNTDSIKNAPLFHEFRKQLPHDNTSGLYELINTLIFANNYHHTVYFHIDK